MGHTNSTTNYGLPQFVTTDKPAWLTDINGAFSAIDTGIDNAQDAADAAQNDATQALSDASAASSAASAADTKGAGAVASIADTFDPTTVYSVGDYVMYNSLLYICSTAVVTPGPWTGSTNWTRITIEDIINNLNGANIPVNATPGADKISVAISAMQSGKQDRILFKQVTGTTTGAGTIDLDLDYNSYTVLNAICLNMYGTYLCFPVASQADNKTYARIYDENLNKVTNSSVVIWVYYIP